MISRSQNEAVLDPKPLTRTQQEALSAIAFFRRQKRVAKGWLVGDKRVSGKVISGLAQLDLVEESVIAGQPVLQLTIVGMALKAQLQSPTKSTEH
jgi:hypothetical protein